MAIETAEVIFLHHQGEHVPGQRKALPIDEATRYVKAKRAKWATKSDAEAAGDTTPAKAKPKG